jgi:DHA1 family inner membrane transport protein
MRKPLLALAVAAFGIGTTEFIIMGLLPDLARDFAVSIPKAGVLVSAYALTVTFGSPLVALALSRINRKTSMLILMMMFTLGNAACAMAPTYGLLLIARMLTGLSHGAFFGIGSIVATHVVPKEQRAQAIAIMFSGLTLANVLGVPAGTALGQAFGWRAAFVSIVPIGLAALVLLWTLVPPQPSEEIHFKHELQAVMRMPVQLVLAISTLSSVAMFCVLTYIAPILENVTHVSPHGVTLVLVAFGVSITVGNLLGGWLADWKQLAVIVGGFIALVLVFVALPFAEPFVTPAVVGICIWGVVHFVAAGPLQARVVEQAKSAPNLASTLNQGAFNLGNALGASLGGLVLTQGLGYRNLSFASAAVAGVALVVSLFAMRVERVERMANA